MVDLSDNKRIYRFGERGQGSRDFLQVASLQRIRPIRVSAYMTIINIA